MPLGWHILIFASLISWSIAGNKNIKHDVEKNSFEVNIHGDGIRKYNVYTPKHKAVTSLLLALHDFGEQRAYFLYHTDFRKHANTYGYELLVPQAAARGGAYPAWNAGGCCVLRNDSMIPNDTHFIEAIIAARRAVYGDVPVYGYGFGNGGMMIETLMCDGVIIKGVDAAGTLAISDNYKTGIAACDERFQRAAALSTETSLLIIHGTFDFFISWSGETAMFGNRVPAKWDNFIGWGARLGCDVTSNNSKQVPWVSTGLLSGFWKIPCPRKTGNKVVMFKVKGGTHFVNLDWRAFFRIRTEDISVAFLYDGREPYQ
ncbi:hypothetical protein FOL47_010759 [Perkinsus chesapeaki]|uniref:Phospholipase/carboxylesterase/thioesterase domain-containing protein n=1 Tax=Perkinsus chesapeaki TaxID=330153 RepID=A0A7J6L081_PERCH|nr:hypothetical protein FOL47_010759 [Perkinsus chesapeaki]